MQPSICAYLEALEIANYARGTITNRDRVLRRYAESVGEVLTCGARDVQLWWLQLGTVSAQTRGHYLTDVRSFYSWAIRHEMRPDDPTRLIVAPRTPTYLPRPVPHAIARGLWERIPDDLDRLVIGLMFGCGLRCAEIAAADREDYDGERLWVHGKGNKTRTVPVPPSLAQLLAAFPPGPILRGREGGRMLPETVSCKYARLLRRYGVLATPHQLRHTFGTEAYRRLRDLRAVQDLMGHASPTTTARYAAVDVSTAGLALADLI